VKPSLSFVKLTPLPYNKVIKVNKSFVFEFRLANREFSEANWLSQAVISAEKQFGAVVGLGLGITTKTITIVIFKGFSLLLSTSALAF